MISSKRTFFKLPIRFKLYSIVLLASTIALLLATSASFLIQQHLIQKQLRDEIQTLADVVSENSRAGLAFEDKKALAVILSSLVAKKSITEAIIFGKNGDISAKYQANDMDGKFDGIEINEQGFTGFRFSGNRAELHQPITIDNERVGQLYIEVDLSEMRDNTIAIATLMGGVLMVGLSLAMLLASQLLKSIIQPITSLSKLTKTISREKSYHVRATVSDILDFSKIEAGQMQFDFRPFTIDRLLESIVSTMNVPAVEKGLQLQVVQAQGLPEAVIGDDLRLQQILLNLVSNAIKFTASGSITIGVEPATEQSRAGKIALHFSVADTGIGIAPEKLAEIFSSFQQADNSYTRQYGGTGLGLTISRQLTELMGGTMWVESRINVGSTFHFVIDFEPDTVQVLENVLTNANISDQVARGLSILVVDDNEVNRDVAQLFLEKDHFVVVAGDGLEALHALGRQPFDVVLMDVQMPQMDGLATTTIVRCLEKGRPLSQELPEVLTQALGGRLFGRHLPIIAMTAHAMGGDREMCLAAGMDSYITKPFQPAQLTEMCRALLAADPTLGRIKEKVVEDEKIATSVEDFGAPVTLARVAAHLRSTTNLTVEQSERVLAAVQRSITDTLAKATAALSREDYPELGRATHTLKGTLLQCGLIDLAATAEEIHQGIRKSSDLPHARLLATLKEKVSGLL